MIRVFVIEFGGEVPIAEGFIREQLNKSLIDAAPQSKLLSMEEMTVVGANTYVIKVEIEPGQVDDLTRNWNELGWMVSDGDQEVVETDPDKSNQENE